MMDEPPPPGDLLPLRMPLDRPAITKLFGLLAHAPPARLRGSGTQSPRLGSHPVVRRPVGLTHSNKPPRRNPLKRHPAMPLP